MGQTVFILDGWDAVARILLVGTLGYTWLVLLLRGTGPRTLGTMTPFDFVITVTLGSAFGRVLTAQEVGLVEAAVTFALLVALQWTFAVLRRRSRGFSRLVDVSPTVVYFRGRPVPEALHRHRLTEADLHSAVRESGRGSLSEAEAIVLQSDGTFAVIGADAMGDGSSVTPYAPTPA
ncbi:MAG TPA: YetF domain-containing protein [Miltoncostaeaceae bacterium]|nr:YetF domain-containing protein [Miltoncostaeaceae bacterium]